MSDKMDKRFKAENRKKLFLVIGAAVAVVLVCIVLVGLLNGQWPWQNNGAGQDYTGMPNNGTSADGTNDPTDGTGDADVTIGVDVPDENNGGNSGSGNGNGGSGNGSSGNGGTGSSGNNSEIDFDSLLGGGSGSSGNSGSGSSGSSGSGSSGNSGSDSENTTPEDTTAPADNGGGTEKLPIDIDVPV